MYFYDPLEKLGPESIVKLKNWTASSPKSNFLPSAKYDQFDVHNQMIHARPLIFMEVEIMNAVHITTQTNISIAKSKRQGHINIYILYLESSQAFPRAKTSCYIIRNANEVVCRLNQLFIIISQK